MTEKKNTQEQKDKVYVTELVKGLEATTALISNLLDDIKDNSHLIGNIRSDVLSISKQIDLLEELVRGDSSHPSILTRLALLERDIADLSKELEKHEEENCVFRANKSKTKIEKLKLWAGIITALISALIGAATAYYLK